jgi:hypothetical protein
MAEFKAGDRVVKMSGAAAGKYGTVNSVREDGTLNVTFDGERLPRYCDPMRCGQVAANAKFKVGDRVRSAKYPELGEMKIVRVFQDIHGTAYRTSRDGFLTDDIHYDRTLIPANSRAANAARNAVALPSDSIHSESDLARAFANKGWKLIMEGNRWTLRDDKGMVRWQDSFGGDAESYDRVFRRFASYLNLR